jgi:cytochrome c oxidase subunit 4
MSLEHAHAPAPAPAGEHAAHDEGHPYVNYWIIFGALCVLTFISWMADEIGNKGLVLTFVVLAVACAKALFVMMYFMHLKFEGKWKFVLLTPTIVLAMAIPAALMPDIGSHYYDFQVPQLADDADTGHAGADHADTPGGEHGGPPAGKQGAAPHHN